MGTNDNNRHIECDGLLRKQNTDPHCYGLDRYSYQQGCNAQFGFTILEDIEPGIVAREIGRAHV